MDTATRTAPIPAAAPSPSRNDRFRRFLVAASGPALIVVAVLFALRGFAFRPFLTNQHPDILTFWLPRSCLLGDALRAGHLPLWNPFEMAGTAYLADAQSGWLDVLRMGTSTGFGCGGAIRAVIVLNPILAGFGLWWFLRKEGLGRVAATAGGLSLAMTMAASHIAISLPFAGSLAWTPFVLVGASGAFSARGWRRAPWAALAAFAWGQVATSHLSHGLVICTALAVAYVVARAVREVRNGRLSTRGAALLGLGLVAFLPLANLAIVVPRFDLLDRSSLRVSYDALRGTLPRVSGLVDRPVPEQGIWSAWPLALGSTPGAYVGATILLAVPFAIRDVARRHLAIAVGTVAVGAYLLTLSLFVGAGWFRALVLRLPFGDVYLHNPGRLRYAAFLAVPILGAIGIQAFLDRRPAFTSVVRWIGGAFVILVVLPLVLGSNPARLVILGLATVAVLGVLWALAHGRRWAPFALAGVLAAELLAGAIWSSVYRGGTVYYGLEGPDHPALVHGPLRWPQVDLRDYLDPPPLARAITDGEPGRYLAWVPPAAYFNKGYLFSQSEADRPALLLGRAIVFGLHDALGYSPIQMPRYWSYIRATNRLPVFYNASIIQEPSPEDARLLGIRYLITHEGQTLPPGITGDVIARDAGFVAYELDAAQPRVSVVPTWTVVTDGEDALAAVLERGFDPAAAAITEGDPGIMAGASATPGEATYVEATPEDVRLTVRASSPSIVVVRNTWEQGWRATVDGVPASVLRTDYLLQGVPVPEGEHEVRLTYVEPSIGQGMLASAVVWLGFVAVVGGAAILARRRRSASEPTVGSGAADGGTTSA